MVDIQQDTHNQSFPLSHCTLRCTVQLRSHQMVKLDSSFIFLCEKNLTGDVQRAEEDFKAGYFRFSGLCQLLSFVLYTFMCWEAESLGFRKECVCVCALYACVWGCVLHLRQSKVYEQINVLLLYVLFNNQYSIFSDLLYFLMLS